MACELRTEAYIPIVKNLFKLDSQKYKNFDNVVQFIANSNLPNENKKLAIHNIAHIYQNLNGLDTEMFELGKANDVINFVVDYDNTEKYLKNITDAYGIKPLKNPTLASIEKMLEDYGSIKGISTQQVNEFADLVHQYVQSVKYDTLEERSDALQSFRDDFYKLISDLSVDELVKDYLSEVLDTRFDKMKIKSNYIALENVAELANMDNYLFSLDNGTMVEGFIQDEKYFIVDPQDNSIVIEIDPKSVLSKKEARPADVNYNNTGKHVFFQDFFQSGFTIDSVSPEEFEGLMEELKQIHSPQSQLKIHAVQLSMSGDNRVNRMHTLAFEEPDNFGHLRNRQHETFESVSQQELLKSDKNAKVVAYSRPKRSEAKFALVGEIIGTGRKFYIYSTDNIAFVNADNSTELLDITNDAHLKELKRLSVKQVGGEQVDLDESDVNFIKSSHEAHAAFKKDVESEFEEALANGTTSIDVTSKFLHKYNVSTERNTPSQTTLLSKALNENTKLGKLVTIVKVDKSNKIISEKEEVLPFVYYKNIDQKQKSISYILTPYLASDERIKIEENGRTILLNEFSYAQELGLNEKIPAMFTKQDARIQEAMDKNMSLKGMPKTGRFVIRFNNDESISYAIAQTRHQLEFNEFFANFAVAFSETVSEEGLTTSMKNFAESFQISPFRDIITFNLVTSLADTIDPDTELKIRQPQIEIRPYSGKANEKYSNIITRDKNPLFNFKLNRKVIIDAVNKFNSPQLIERIIKENPTLANYDLTKPEDRISFYKSIFQVMNNSEASPSIKEFIKNFEAGKKELIDHIVSTVDKQLSSDGLQPEYQEFKEQLKTDLKLNSTDDVTAESLLLMQGEDGEQILRIESPKNSAARGLFNRSYNNVSVVTNDSRKSFNITLKTTPTKEDTVTKTLTPQEQEIVAEVKKEETTPDTTAYEGASVVQETKTEEAEDTTTTDEYDEDEGDAYAPFQLLGETIDVATNEDLETEAAWLSNALPQIGLSNQALKEIVDLTKINGVVLGLFKDKMIHLNDKLTSKGIIYHEAFHGVFRHLMTQAERDSLIKAVMNDSKHASKFTSESVYKFGKDRNYSENNYDVLARLVAEEILADGFQSYMLKKKTTEPKTALQRFFDMLRKLLEFFVKNKSLIENTYQKIQSGHYGNRTYQSGIFENKVAFELIPIQTVRTKTPDGKSQFAKHVTLTTYEQTQLLNIINAQIFSDYTEKESFDVKFQKAVDTLLEKVISIENLVSQNPSKKDEIMRSKWAVLFNKYRFVLGGRMKNLPVYDINLTDDPTFDKKKTKLMFASPDGLVDNSDGSQSFELLKKLSKISYEKANSLDIIRDEQSDVVDSDELQKAINGETQEQYSDEQATSAQDELESNDFDSSYGQANPIDSYVRQVRRYFATIRNDIEDKELGIKIPRVIDGNMVFPSMLKTSANVQPRFIIQTIGMMAEKMIQDGYAQQGSDMKAVYDDIVLTTGMDPLTGTPTKNHQLFNVVTDALHGVELNYLFFNHRLPEEATMEMTAQQTMELANKQLEFSLIDKVADTDSTTKRNQILTAFIKSFKQNGNKEEYKKAVQKISTLIENIIINPDFLNGRKTQSVILKEMAAEFNEAFEEIGFKLPKSLIELSLATIYTKENGMYNELDKEDNLFMTLNSNFISQNQYLELDFFRSLKDILKDAYITLENGEVRANRNFAKRLDDTTKNPTDRRLLLILKKASAYISKYDPTSLPPVIKNAEGKSIYRYAKINPLLNLAQRLNTMTLDEAISNDPYYSRVRDYMLDNPFLAPLLKDPESEEARIPKLFLQNFNVAMFGGVQQQVGKFTKDGKTFKNIDKRSMYALQILSFLNRRKVNDKFDNELSLFYRSFHQNEATQTNFLIPAIYTPFINPNPIADDYKIRENGSDKIVNTLLDTVKQEYNRIQREWSTRVQRKEDYDSGKGNNNIVKFNGELNPDGKTLNTENDNLRAYNFNKLADFFSMPINAGLKEQLIAFAKQEGDSKVSFEEITNTKELKKALSEYADLEFQKYKQELINEGLIEVKAIPDDKLDTKPVNALKPAVKVYYTSSLLPKYVKTDVSKNEKTDLSAVYPNLPGFDHKTTFPDIVPLDHMLYDYFMNHWKNSLETNELMDGDIAMNVKNFQDYVKRLKKIVASGSNFKEGFHTVAYINTIKGFVHDKYPYHGPYYSLEQLENDFSVPNETIRAELREGYKKAEANVKEPIDGKTVKWGDMMRETFDGQSISTLFHQLDMHDSIGRVDDRVIDILIAKNYRALTESEIKYLSSKKVVNNAKKTVTAGRNIYNKNSEDYTDRLDVSRLIIEPQEGESMQDATNRVFDELHAAYAEVYSLRRASHYLSILDNNHPDIAKYKLQIQKIYTDKIHQYYEALPHRKLLHNVLNSMEYHQIDQLLDTTATKNATKVPIDIFKYERDENDYIRFDLSSTQIPNEDKYLQVETSGVKEKAKHSVQSKLLLPADLSEKILKHVVNQANEKLGITRTEAQDRDIARVQEDLKKYQLSLGKATKARLAYFKNILREGKDFEVGKIYKMIRKSLEEQNAPTNTLKYFDLKPDGSPVYSPNLSVIRSTLEYYLLSQYSNNVTDEKTAGGKSFHTSSVGHDVLVDTVTNTVITSEEVSQNPEKYNDETRYKSRPLSVSIEEQADGSKIYFTECIIPKPIFENKQQEAFYMENLIKMFAVRIPTEDKRSMIVLKVVDFIDSSKMNNIIVPHYVHMLSGSDFDIDSLFMRMKSYYKNGKNEYNLFGDYSNYKNEQAGKFVEFIHFMQKHDDFALALKAEKQRLINENTFELSDESPVFELLDAMNYNLATDVLEFFDRKELKSKLKDEKEFTSYMISLAKDAKELYIETKLDAEANPVDKELSKLRNQYGYEYAVIKDVKQKSIQEKRALRERLKIVDAAYEYQAALNVFADLGIPASIEAFNSNPVYNDMVSMKHQNDNLDASIALLSNEAVFNSLYINQRASVEQFLNILEKGFGLSLEDLTQKGNLYTATNMVLSKVENSSSKDGLGRSAVMNKFLAVASQIEATLLEQNTIWKFRNEKGELKTYDKFGQINEQGDRVISLIGNILGMFADAAKDPIPSALQLNEVNITTTLAMLGIGLKPEFALGFNFLPKIREASKKVQQANFAISEDIYDDYAFFDKAIGDEINNMLSNSTILAELSNLGVVEPTSTNYQPKIKGQNVVMQFEPKSLKGKDLDTLIPSEIGFKITNAKGVELTDAQAEALLMMYYWEQSKQTWSINRVANMTNLFKRLNPSMAAFDRQRDGISRIKSGELFTEESVDRLFKSQDSIWQYLSEGLDDANEQFSKILLERSDFFQNVTGMYSKYFKEPKVFANVVTSYLGLSRFVKTYPGSRSVDNEYMQDIIDQDDMILKESFTPEYWFTNSLAAELEEMQNKYPENEFLKLLKPQESDKTAVVNFEGKDYTTPERFLQIMSRAKITGEFQNTITDSIYELYNKDNAEDRLFIKKLFYHELVRTGMLPKMGSFFQFMPAELVLPISQNIDAFIDYMRNADKDARKNIVGFMKDYLGTDDETETFKFFDELFNQIAYAAASEKGNSKIPTYKYYGEKKKYPLSIKKISSTNTFRTNINIYNYLEEGNNNPSLADMIQARSKLITAFYKMFNSKFDESKNIDEANSINLESLLKDEFTLNLNDDLAKPTKSLSKVFKVKYDKDAEAFEFPTLIRVAGKVYVLQSTDISSAEGMSSGEALIKSFAGESIYTNLGVVANYKAIPEIYSSDKFSALAFTAEQADRYKSYTQKEQKIKFVKPGSTTETETVTAPKVEKTTQAPVSAVKPKSVGPSEDIMGANETMMSADFFKNMEGFDWTKVDNDSEDPLDC